MRPTVLLVDDEADIREVLEIALTDMGYHVLQAEQALKALDIFRKESPPLVVTDIKMPGMDGIELLKRIKAESPETEVIIITGHGDMELAIQSLKHKATDFITKPINVSAIEIAMQRACDKIVMRQKLREYTENLERLVREKTELQDHLSSLGLMISSISHSIKGLLTGLDGGMYLLDSGFAHNDQERVQEGWETVKVIVERIRKLVLDILFYAKKRELQWERVDVLSFVKEVAKVFEKKAQQQHIEFKCNFDQRLGAFDLDPGLIHTALTNIIENAMDACLKDRTQASPRIVFYAGQDDHHILFQVSDNGIGMNPETCQQIFKLFFSTKGEKGTGLGLFIAEKIINQHGGSILVESAKGQGTTFTISIPKVWRKAKTGPAKQPVLAHAEQ